MSAFLAALLAAQRSAHISAIGAACIDSHFSANDAAHGTAIFPTCGNSYKQTDLPTLWTAVVASVCSALCTSIHAAFGTANVASDRSAFDAAVASPHWPAFYPALRATCADTDIAADVSAIKPTICTAGRRSNESAIASAQRRPQSTAKFTTEFLAHYATFSPAVLGTYDSALKCTELPAIYPAVKSAKFTTLCESHCTAQQSAVSDPNCAAVRAAQFNSIGAAERRSYIAAQHAAKFTAVSSTRCVPFQSAVITAVVRT